LLIVPDDLVLAGSFESTGFLWFANDLGTSPALLPCPPGEIQSPCDQCLGMAAAGPSSELPLEIVGYLGLEKRGLGGEGPHGIQCFGVQLGKQAGGVL
jgi:hypothetical protein